MPKPVRKSVFFQCGRCAISNDMVRRWNTLKFNRGFPLEKRTFRQCPSCARWCCQKCAVDEGGLHEARRCFIPCQSRENRHREAPRGTSVGGQNWTLPSASSRTRAGDERRAASIAAGSRCR